MYALDKDKRSKRFISYKCHFMLYASGKDNNNVRMVAHIKDIRQAHPRPRTTLFPIGSLVSASDETTQRVPRVKVVTIFHFATVI